MSVFNFYEEFDGVRSLPVNKDAVSCRIIANSPSNAIDYFQKRFKHSDISTVDHISDTEYRVFLTIHHFFKKDRELIFYAVWEGK